MLSSMGCVSPSEVDANALAVAAGFAELELPDASDCSAFAAEEDVSARAVPVSAEEEAAVGEGSGEDSAAAAAAAAEAALLGETGGLDS